MYAKLFSNRPIEFDRIMFKGFPLVAMAIRIMHAIKIFERLKIPP